MLGEENVPGIAAIHHPLRHVDPSAGDISPPTHVGHVAHRAAVNAHPHCESPGALEGLCDLERTLRRFLRTVAKDERHPVPGRKPNELLIRRFAHLRRRQHDVGELSQPFFLLLDQELGKTDQIDKQDVPDLESKIALRFRGHTFIFTAKRKPPAIIFRRRRFNGAGAFVRENGAGEGNRTPVFGPRSSQETILRVWKDIQEHACNTAGRYD